MTPDELIQELKRIGVIISQSTLNEYEAQGLISAPVRGSYGRAGERWTDYPRASPGEVYAAYCLLEGGGIILAHTGNDHPCSPTKEVKVITGKVKAEIIAKIRRISFGDKDFPENLESLMLAWIKLQEYAEVKTAT